MRRRKVSKFLAWALSFVLLLSVLSQTVLAFHWPWEEEASSVAAETPKPDLTLYARCEPVRASVIHAGNLKGTERNLARLLCDGDETTVFTHPKVQEITLDLGRVHMLGGVRFLPAAGEKETDVDRCIGTAFWVSTDNRNFQKAAVAEPIDNLSYTPEWKELMFGGAGEVRYVKITIPAGARIAEVQWLSYPEWKYTKVAGKTQWNLRLYGYDIQRELDANIVVGAYNRQGVLKSFSVTQQTFMPQEDRVIDLHLNTWDKEIGDSYRVMAWDQDGKSLLARDLRYVYTKASPAFSMSNLFSDHMMLQADKPLTVWGTAPAGSRVQTTLTDDSGSSVTQTATADVNGDWETNLGNFSAGGSYILTVDCGGERKVFKNLIFGDIWLCMGQSNMDYHLLGGEDTAAYLRTAKGKKESNNPQIRLLNLWMKGTSGAGGAVSNLPVGYVNPAWSVMNRDAASYCTAIGYFFAQKIQEEYHLPVGILNVAVGDTEINRWLPFGQTFGSFAGSDGGLYYNRVLPFQKLQIRGILMYQGEADYYRTHLTTEQYRDALSGLVDLYRGIWGEDLPFYWAQLARHQNDTSLIREGQRLALGQISNPKNAGVFSLMDIYGEYKSGAGNCREDIHPHQKQEVADRFFRYAKRDVYGGADTIVSGPVYQGVRRIGNTLELVFDCEGSLKVLPPEQYCDARGKKWIADNKMDVTKPQGFEVAGSDGVFHQGEAELSGNTVVLKSEQVPNPVQARYAWGAYPEMPNLTDDSGLPALSFCTELTS